MIGIGLLSRVNEWLLRAGGGDSRPAFLDIDAVYPSLRALDAAYPQIRAEAVAVLRDGEQVPTYAEIDPAQRCLADVTPGSWRVFYLWAMGEAAAPNSARCPATMAALARVPGLFAAYFSILDPGKSVPAHRTMINCYLRYHLGLSVPTVDPPTLRVRDEYRSWSDGASLLFDDTWEHEVINNCRQPRMVLIVDVLRPMPWWPGLVNRAVVPLVHRHYGRDVLRLARQHATGPQQD